MRNNNVLWNTLTIQVHLARVVLGFSVPLLGRKAYTLYRLIIVLGHTQPLVICMAKSKLGLAAGQIRRLPQHNLVIYAIGGP